MDLTAQTGRPFTTASHDRLRDEVRRFADTEVRPHIPEMERSRSVQHEHSRLIAERGWIGVTIGPEHGGLGLGHLAKTIVIEELSRVSGAMGAMAQASQLRREDPALRPHGLGADSAVQRCFRDAHHIFAPAGTSDIQRKRLAETALGTSHVHCSTPRATKSRSDPHRTAGRTTVQTHMER